MVEAPPRRTRLVVLLAVAVLGLGGWQLQQVLGAAAASTVQVSGPVWQCTGTTLVAAQDPTGLGSEDPGTLEGPRRIPLVDTGTECWGTWWVGSTRDDVELHRLTLPFGGPATGAGFRVDRARVDDAPVDLLVPDTSGERFPEPRYETVVPVGRTLSPDGVEVSVRVVPGEGCSGPGAIGMSPELALSIGPLPTSWSGPWVMPEAGEGSDLILEDPGLALAFAEGSRSDCSS